MATKSKTTTKPRTAKKTVKGSGGLKKSNTNWKFIIVLLVLVTAVGGYFAYRSQVSALAETTYGVTSANVTRSGGSVANNKWSGGPGNWISFKATITQANFGAPEYCAVVSGGTYGIGGDTAWTAGGGGTDQEITQRIPTTEIRNLGGGRWKVCSLLNTKLQRVNDTVTLFVCGRKDVKEALCKNGAGKGNLTVEYFVRPAY